MDALREGLAALGVAAGRVHTEIFGAAGVDHARSRRGSDAGAASTRGRTGLGTAHLVRAYRAQRALGRQAAPSILELAEACDVPVRWSCRTGVCHTCETGLLDGTVDYFPEPLEAPADGNLLVCCSRARHRPRDRPVIDGSVDDLGAFHSMWFTDPDGMQIELVVIVDDTLAGIHEPRPLEPA